VSSFDDLLFGEAGGGRYVCGCKGGDELSKFFEAVGVLGNVVVIDQPFAQEDVGDAIEQGDVGAGVLLRGECRPSSRFW
jgi:hypothetical protein